MGVEVTLNIDQLHRFWCSFKRGTPDECWPWLATVRKREGKNKDILYGSFSINGRNYLAHRVAYQLEYGPEELCILHRCDYGLCVNPSHLFAGTREDNNHDTANKGRTANGNTLLNGLQAREIWDYKGIITQIELARMYRVSRSCIQQIHDKRTWLEIHT